MSPRRHKLSTCWNPSSGDTLAVSYLFTLHDLAVVRHISHTIGVMYLGNMVELGLAEWYTTPPPSIHQRFLLLFRWQIPLSKINGRMVGTTATGGNQRPQACGARVSVCAPLSLCDAGAP
jgi:ABC-type dipeptide/oligopeptide/nickel transport system ATPase component